MMKYSFTSIALRSHHLMNHLEPHKSISRILVIEDDVISQRVTKIMLQRLMYEVDVASTGKQALKLEEQQSYALILLDIGLPDLSGIEVASHIRKRNNTTPIVALTAHGDSMKSACLAAGMNDLLPKPLILENLAKLLQRWLPKSSP